MPIKEDEIEHTVRTFFRALGIVATLIDGGKFRASELESFARWIMVSL